MKAYQGKMKMETTKIETPESDRQPLFSSIAVKTGAYFQRVKGRLGGSLLQKPLT